MLPRFLQYIAIDTQSNPESETYPSTHKQFDLLKLLQSELIQMKLSEVQLDEKGYLTATLPANCEKEIPVIGFIAHVDTSPDMSGCNIKPQIIKNYDGGDIILNADKNIVMRVAEFPELNHYKQQTLITTDGTTLLGADDKAGIAVIVSAIEYLLQHPEIEHGTVKIAFTPDEEIGKGVDFFDVEKFGATYAYTVDGGEIGELEYENFNAAAATIKIQGRNVHPGYAKNKMINAQLVGMELHQLLPSNERPEHTSHYEGFYLLTRFSGAVEDAELQYIIRDHSKKAFEYRKHYMQQCVDFLNQKYGENTMVLSLKDQYYNMVEKITPHQHIIDIAAQAMQQAGVKVKIKPIRGGTDGARLSYMGLPCPNIFAGGHNFHGKYEFIPLESMEKSKETVINIIKLFAESVKTE